jgi:molybdenum cofactor synthesis domain-containing protein
MKDPISAAILVIGDEILSGRTKDKNIGYIADYLFQIGIDLREVRIVPDEEDAIIEAVNALRQRYTYLFTTGGIGPTHDDITADCVAKALNVEISEDPRAVALLQTRYKPEDLNAARLRMARIPSGADLIANPITTAPGFKIDNVIVMAGVPNIMQAMLDSVMPSLKTGVRMLVKTIDASPLREGAYGPRLGELAKMFPDVSIGSYPSFREGGFYSEIVLRSKNSARLLAAEDAVLALLENLKREI